MEILVVTPHTDDFIYGVGGTLITHADDDIHIVAVSSIQQTAARDVAAAFGATIEFLEAPYHRISDHAPRVKDALAGILKERRPAYIFGPPATGDWTSDHTTVGRVLLDATDLANTLRLQEPRPALPDRVDDARFPSERLDRPAGRASSSARSSSPRS